MYNQDSTVLKNDTHFHFKTFGFDVEAQVEEYDLDAENGVLRLACMVGTKLKVVNFLTFTMLG